MKRLAMVMMVMAAAVVIGGGCATGRRAAGPDPATMAYYGQPRTADLLTLKGTNMTVTYTGVSEYRVSSMLPPLPAPERAPGVIESVVGSVTDLGRWGLGWYYGSRIATTAFTQPRTVNPVVVQPEVVTVGGE